MLLDIFFLDHCSPNNEIDFEEKSINFDLLDYHEFSNNGNTNESLDISTVNLYFMKNSSLGEEEKNVQSIKLTIPCHTPFPLDFINLTNNKNDIAEVKFEFDLTKCINKRYSFEEQSSKHIVESNQTHRPCLGVFCANEEGDFCIRIICKPFLLIVECTLSVHHLSLQYIPTFQPKISNSNQIELCCFFNDKCFQPNLTFKLARKFDCSFILNIMLQNNCGLMEFQQPKSNESNTKKDILSIFLNRRSSIVIIKMNVFSRNWTNNTDLKPIITYSVGSEEMSELEYSKKSFEISLKKFTTVTHKEISILQSIYLVSFYCFLYFSSTSCPTQFCR